MLNGTPVKKKLTILLEDADCITLWRMLTYGCCNIMCMYNFVTILIQPFCLCS